MKSRFLYIGLLLIILAVFGLFLTITSNAADPYARRIRPVTSFGACSENEVAYNMATHIFGICDNSNTFKTLITSGGVISGSTFLAGNGTVAAPSFSFTSDPDTGIFRDSANVIGFTTNGVEKWVINSSGAFNPLINNTYDIGNGSVNPRDLNLARKLILYGATSGNISFNAAPITTSYGLIWPSAQSVGSQALLNDGTGNLSWGSAGITNSAGNNIIPKSNGTNLVASQINDDGNSVVIADGAGKFVFIGGTSPSGLIEGTNSTVIGDFNANGNGTILTVDDAAGTVIISASNGLIVNQINLGGGAIAGINTLAVANSSTSALASTVQPINSAFFGNAANNSSQIICSTCSGNKIADLPNLTGTFLFDTSNIPLSSSLTSDGTTTSATLATTNISVTVVNGSTYEFTCILFLSDSLAADGAKIDFNGGSATASNFRAHVTSFDSALNLSTQVTALSTAITMSTLTGASMIEIHGTFTASGNGTVIPRYAQNAHTTGTLTIAKGSNLILRKVS